MMIAILIVVMMMMMMMMMTIVAAMIVWLMEEEEVSSSPQGRRQRGTCTKRSMRFPCHCVQGEVDDDGNVQRQSRGLPRPSAASCLNYVFLQQADQPRLEAPSSSLSGSDSVLEDGTPAAAGGEAGAWSNAFGAWKKISGRLFALEASIVSQVRSPGSL